MRLHRALPLAPWILSLMVPHHLFFEFPCLTFDSAAVWLVEDQEPPFSSFLVNLFIRPSWVFTPAFLRPALLWDLGPDVWALGSGLEGSEVAVLQEKEPSLPDKDASLMPGVALELWCDCGRRHARKQDRVTVGFSCFRAWVFPEGEQS